MPRILNRISLARLFPFLLPLTLFGCYPYPDSGHWKGNAVFRDGTNRADSCALEVDITHEEEFLSLNNLWTDCGGRYSHWNPGAFTVRSLEVWRDQRRVGQAFSNGSVQLSLDSPYLGLDYPYPARRVVVNWARVEKDLQFSETIYYDGKVQTLDAWLSRDGGH